MSGEMPRRWALLLDALLQAQSLDRAQLAASDLIDELVPGGAATSVGGSDFVRLVRSSTEIRANPYRSYLLGVLLAMATWVGSWRRAATRDSDPGAFQLKTISESATEAELAAICTDFAEFSHDEDPEVRALTYLLTGAVALPAGYAMEQLEGLADQETHPLAHACAVQALVKVIVRLPEEDRVRAASRISGRIMAGSALDGARVKVELESVAHPPAEQRQLVDLIGLGFSEGLQTPVYWPAESV